jgi:hypothetical protein
LSLFLPVPDRLLELPLATQVGLAFAQFCGYKARNDG